MNKTKQSKIGYLFGTALLGVLTGCIVDGPRRGAVHVQSPVVHVQPAVVIEDDYVYYPGYQVYYASRTRQYVYLEGSAWVWRPAPPRVTIDVLFASPSVKVDFHDAPALHHATVIQTYPKSWTPPGQGRGKKVGHMEKESRGERNDDHHGNKESKKGHKNKGH